MDPKLFRQDCYINGKWLTNDKKEPIKVFNPATAELLGSAPNFSEKCPLLAQHVLANY